MAKDVNMKKGDSMISVSKDFVDHYTKLGYQVIENNKKFQLQKKLKRL